MGGYCFFFCVCIYVSEVVFLDLVHKTGETSEKLPGLQRCNGKWPYTLILCLDYHETFCNGNITVNSFGWFHSLPSAWRTLSTSLFGSATSLPSGEIIGRRRPMPFLLEAALPSTGLHGPCRCWEGEGAQRDFPSSCRQWTPGPAHHHFCWISTLQGRFIFSWHGRVKRGEKRLLHSPVKVMFCWQTAANLLGFLH